MIAEYIQAALRHARYELEEEVFYAEVPELPGVLAYGSTLEECRTQLIEVVEGWLIIGIRHGDILPVLDAIDSDFVMLRARSGGPVSMTKMTT